MKNLEIMGEQLVVKFIALYDAKSSLTRQINNTEMFVLCKVLITRRDPFSENLCVSDSTLDKNNVYKQKMKVKYSSTVSIYTFQLWSLHVGCDSRSFELDFGT